MIQKNGPMTKMTKTHSISLMPLSAEKDSDDELRLVSVRHGTGPVHALSEGIDSSRRSSV